MKEELPAVVAIAEGLCYKTMCAINGTDKEEILLAAGIAGTRRGWQFADNEKFATGEPNPCPCNELANRTHWLLSC
jgi:hypothetical protein